MKRWIKKTNRGGQTFQSFEDANEIVALVRKEFGQSPRPFIFRTSKNHLSHGVNAIAFKEHMLCAAEPDAFRTECDCVCNLLGGIRVCAHAQ